MRYVPKKGGALVGFHERKSSYVADMRSCEILPRRLSRMLLPLRVLVDGLSIRSRMPQIEVAIGGGADVLVFRVLQPLQPSDVERLRRFAADHAVKIHLQPGGPDSTIPLAEADEADLYYDLPEFDLRIRFAPTDFTQVNHAVNAVLVRRAIALLAESPVTRMMANFFIGMRRMPVPIQMFTDRSEAVSWLQRQS